MFIHAKIVLVIIAANLLFSCSSQTTQVIGVVVKVGPERVLGGYKQKVTYSYLYQDSTYYRTAVRGSRFELLKESDSLLVEVSLDDVSDGKIIRRLKPIVQAPIKTYKIDSNQGSSDASDVSTDNLLEEVIDDLEGLGTVYQANFLDEKPQFPGSEDSLLSFLRAETEYEILEKGDSGSYEVFLRFIVDENGCASYPLALEEAPITLVEEAKRLISRMPKWKAGSKDGNYVKTYMTLSIYFRLPSN